MTKKKTYSQAEVDKICKDHYSHLNNVIKQKDEVNNAKNQMIRDEDEVLVAEEIQDEEIIEVGDKEVFLRCPGKKEISKEVIFI